MTQGQSDNNNKPLEDKEKTPSPPYISFLTFNNFITWLEGEGIPLKFDRSFWGKKYAGSTGMQLMAGLRFLGLLKGDAPQPQLEEIVKARGEERKALLAKVLRQAYSAIDFQALERATPNMLSEWLRTYNLDGNTLRKAESFFINACKAYDVPLSNALKKKARNKPAKSALGASKEKRSEKSKVVTSSTGRQVDKPSRDSSADSREQVSKVALVSGGEVALTLNVDLFQLSKEDRDFVINLVDIMKGYGNKTTK